MLHDLVDSNFTEVIRPFSKKQIARSTKRNATEEYREAQTIITILEGTSSHPISFYRIHCHDIRSCQARTDADVFLKRIHKHTENGIKNHKRVKNQTDPNGKWMFWHFQRIRVVCSGTGIRPVLMNLTNNLILHETYTNTQEHASRRRTQPKMLTYIFFK